MHKLSLAISAMLIAGTSFAQFFGNATLTMNIGGTDRKFVFNPANTSLVTASQISGGNNYTDIDYSCQFEAQHEYVMVHMRIEPSGKGSFIIPPENSQPTNMFHIEVMYQKQNANGDIIKQIQLVDNSAHDGASGSANITQYGAIGTDVIGSFEATIREAKDGSAQGGLFKVSGNFKAKLMKQ